MSGLDLFERLESNVRSYGRMFPTVFVRAEGYRLIDRHGRIYLDFFAGAGALNYGHNDSAMKAAIIRYLEADGIVHSLDMATEAKGRFLHHFENIILKPRGLNYKVLFPGPTGTNAVEAAMKLARKATGRTAVYGFTRGFHGMTLGSLAVTGNRAKRAGAGVPLPYGMALPYDGYFGPDVDTIDWIERLLTDPGSGVDLPAAIIVETVQGEGGLQAASWPWLRRLRALTERLGIVLIVDDIQTGSGRTGPFFSFERAGIVPDIVTLSKSIGGFGLPFSLVLVRPDLDVLGPGVHNGTFRGNNLAMVAATEALRRWETPAFEAAIDEKAALLRRRLEGLRDAVRERGIAAEVRGRGLMQGLWLEPPGLASAVSREAFRRGLIVETSGPEDEVVKLLPPLIIDEAGLEDGLMRLEAAILAAIETIRSEVAPSAVAGR
ncbi:diaminobutyrate--2-oxoglutarate transaminase [Hydrogenibacillus schlegelii]|nr:diaminobutyrate--2-oxoglutarate transaminase [Hydrogenibacillus schlegelii]